MRSEATTPTNGVFGKACIPWGTEGTLSERHFALPQPEIRGFPRDFQGTALLGFLGRHYPAKESFCEASREKCIHVQLRR